MEQSLILLWHSWRVDIVGIEKVVERVSFGYLPELIGYQFAVTGEAQI
jgi:hypothetical protein